MRARRAAIGLLVAASLTGCASAGTGDGTNSNQSTASPTGQSIQQVLDAQVAAWNRGDLESFMKGYWRSRDLVFTSGGKVQRGWGTTLQRYRDTYGRDKSSMGTLHFSDLEVHPLGPDAAWALGRWSLDGLEGGKRGGVFTLVFRRIGGRWVIVHDHTSVER